MNATAPGGYAPTESFESGRVTAVAADDERIVVGTGTSVEVVSADGRNTVEFDAPIDDLAVGNRVYALAGGSVVALSAAGTRVWSVELPEAEKLAALPEADVLGVVTDDDALLGFDGETGGEEFDVPRPHADVTDDPGFFGTDGAFVLVAWSFLAVRNVDGTERFDLNLDGAIESAGIVGDTVVVSLKDERVLGVHATTGERQWERELAVTDLPDRGDDALLFTAGGQLVSLSADGTYATVEELPSGDVYPTSDGSLFCAIADGTIGVYCSTGDPAESLDVTADGELVPGATDAVSLRVRNAGDRPVSATLRADGEGVALAESDLPVDLAPGESTTASFGVEAVTADETAALAFAADGDHVASVSFPVESPPSESLDATAELDAVTDGIAALAVVVENAGDAPATGVSLARGDADIGRLAPGESATATVELPYDPGATATVAGDDTEVVTETSMPTPACDLSVEAASDGFVDVRVENRTGVRLEDDLTVESDGLDSRVERRVELPPEGHLVLALRPEPVRDAVTVDAALVGLGVDRSAQVESGRLAAGRGSSRGTPARGGSDAGTATARDASSGSAGRASGDASNRSGRGETATESAGRRDGSASQRPDGDASSDALGRTGDTAGVALSARRQVKPTDPARTQGVRERVVVENEGGERAAGVRVELADETVPVGELAPGERTTLERRHAFAETGEVVLPAARVVADGGADDRIEERVLSVTPAELAADADLEPDDGGYRLRVAVTNDRDVGCDVDRIGVRELGVWDVDIRVPAGETVEWTRRVDASGLSDVAVETAVEYAFDDGESNRWGTLARVPVGDDSTDTDLTGVDALSPSVGEETRVSGGYGSVVLSVENSGGSPVSDVSVEATGEPVSDLMYAGRESVEELAPGESFTHFVDVETEGPEVSVSVALSVGDDEADLTLRGPAPADEDDWSQAALADWRVERDDDATDDGSGRVVSAFETAN